MLERSDEAKRLVSTFFSYRNAIDIYTEDEEKDKEFYKNLFKRLLEDQIEINDITPLGSKKNVLTRCENEPDNGRKKLFIVDGDITIVHGNNIPTLDNLFVLEAYSIENFVFEKHSVIQYIYENCAIKSKETIEKEVDYENWLNLYTSKLIELFIHFALTDYYGGNFTLFNAKKFHKNDIFLEEMVDAELQRLKKYILGITSEECYKEKYNELSNKWEKCVDSLLTIVSGKDYLIPILQLKTMQYKNSKIMPSIQETKFKLVQYCKLERLSKLKEVIESL